MNSRFYWEDAVDDFKLSSENSESVWEVMAELFPVDTSGSIWSEVSSGKTLTYSPSREMLCLNGKPFQVALVNQLTDV